MISLIRADEFSEISLFRLFSIFTVMLLGPFALFKFKVFNIFAAFSSVVEDKNNFFVLLFVKKELTECNFSNFPAINIKRISQ